MATVTYNGFVVWVNRCVITPQAAPGVDCARVKLALRLLGRRAETLFNEVVGVVDIPQRPAPPVAPPRIALVSSAEGADPHWRGAGPVLSRIRAHLQEDPEFEKSFPGGFREILVDILVQGVREERFPPAEEQPLGTVTFPHQVQDVMNGIRDRVAGVSWGDKSAIHMLRQAVAYAWRVYVDRVLSRLEDFIRWHIAVFGSLKRSPRPDRAIESLRHNVEQEGEHLGIPLTTQANGRVVFPWTLVLHQLGHPQAQDARVNLQEGLAWIWEQVPEVAPGAKPVAQIVRITPRGLSSEETRSVREHLPCYQALAVAVREDLLGAGAQPISAGGESARIYQRVAVLARPLDYGVDGLTYTDGIQTWTAQMVRPAPTPLPPGGTGRFSPKPEGSAEAPGEEKGFWRDADVISRYSRADMLADGSLVDVSTVDGEQLFQEAGIRLPVAMTRAAYQKMVAMPEAEPKFDQNTPLGDIVAQAVPRIEQALRETLPDEAHVQATLSLYGHALLSGWAARRGLSSTHLGSTWRDAYAPRLPEVFPPDQVSEVTTEDAARRLISSIIPQDFTLTVKKGYSTWDAELRIGGQRFTATLEKTRKAALQNLLQSHALLRWIWVQRLLPYTRLGDDDVGQLKELIAVKPRKPTPAERAGNDVRGRAWDVAIVLAQAIRKAPKNSRVVFTAYAVTDRITPGPVQLQAVIGPGDDGDPVITVGLADEDLS